MALFKISVTKRMISNNMVIEPGMSVLNPAFLKVERL